jgi:hypothetical protein
MTAPETDTRSVTLIDVFEIEPEKLESFLEGWRERAAFMNTQPGSDLSGCTARYRPTPASNW